MNWYLVFIGTTTIPLRATSSKAARERVVGEYRERGITLRKATWDDAGWLRDMGATEIADSLLGVS